MQKKLKVEVVAALIWRKDKFMACQRPPEKARGLLWEFVGGKVEPGETKKEALARECKEELDITVAVGSEAMDVTHEYPDIIVHLTLFESYILNGEPKLLEHRDLRWITIAQINELDFCPADEVILQWIKNSQNRVLNKSERTVRAKLFSMQDEEYKRFHSGLMPAVPAEQVIGVRLPKIRGIASKMSDADKEAFLQTLPHRYYEENNLHALILNDIDNWKDLCNELNRFLPYINNWATCDSLRPKIFSENLEEGFAKIKMWLSDNNTFTVRFGLEMLMVHYLDEKFIQEALNIAANVKSDEYYIQMMQAWFFATALAKQWDRTIVFLQKCKLEKWVHNKSIQKALESKRINAVQKEYLRTLKILK